MQKLYLMQKVLDPGLAEPNSTERGKGIGMSSPKITSGSDKSPGPHCISFLPS